MDYLYLSTDVEKNMNVFLDVNQNEIVTFGKSDKPSTNEYKISGGAVILLSAIVRHFGYRFLIDKTTMMIIFIVGCFSGFIFQRWLSGKTEKKQILKDKRILSMTNTEILCSSRNMIVTNYKFIVCSLLLELVVYFLNYSSKNFFLNLLMIILPFLIGIFIGVNFRLKNNRKKFLRYRKENKEEKNNLGKFYE